MVWSGKFATEPPATAQPGRGARDRLNQTTGDSDTHAPEP